MTEMYKQLADAGGIAYETNTQIKMSAASGSGNPLGGILARMGTCRHRRRCRAWKRQRWLTICLRHRQVTN